MKQDVELCRKILMAVEQSPDADGSRGIVVSIDGYSPGEISYHVRLLDEEGLLEAKNDSTLDGLNFKPKRLTSNGHKFLAATKEESAWTKLKSMVRDKGGNLSMAVLTRLVIKAATGL